MDLNILISASHEPERLTAYREAVCQAGGIPHGAYLPAVDISYAGLILCGGDDIDPAYYGQENRGSTGVDVRRDEAELALVSAYLAAGKPILAICRGHQLLNVALGGSLIQDLDAGLLPFHRVGEGETGDRTHSVRAQAGSILHGLYGEIFSVNSYHHQAADAIGRDLSVTTRSESGLAEALEHRQLPVLGVQFHPERMTGAHASPRHAEGGAIFAWFLARCREGAESPLV